MDKSEISLGTLYVNLGIFFSFKQVSFKQVPHTNPLFKALKILKFKDQIELFNCLLVHDQLNISSQKTLIYTYFTTNKDLNNIDTRSSKTTKLFIPYVNSTHYGRHSVKHSLYTFLEPLYQTIVVKY